MRARDITEAADISLMWDDGRIELDQLARAYKALGVITDHAYTAVDTWLDGRCSLAECLLWLVNDLGAGGQPAEPIRTLISAVTLTAYQLELASL